MVILFEITNTSTKIVNQVCGSRLDSAMSEFIEDILLCEDETSTFAISFIYRRVWEVEIENAVASC